MKIIDEVRIIDFIVISILSEILVFELRRSLITKLMR